MGFVKLFVSFLQWIKRRFDLLHIGRLKSKAVEHKNSDPGIVAIGYRAPPSLINIGANCYLNSAFQGISSCDAFVKDVHKLCEIYPAGTVKKLDVFKELIDILNGCSTREMEISSNPIFCNWNKPGQQDSYEVLAHSMNQVYNDIRAHMEKEKTIQRRDLQQWLQQPLPMRFILDYTITCGCGMVSHSPLQSDLAFHVTIIKDKEKLELSKLFNSYFKKDPIEDYECDKNDCDGKNAFRVARLCNPVPRTICIHLQRTEWNGFRMEKINDGISFGFTLVVKSKYWTENGSRTAESNKAKGDLMAQILRGKEIDFGLNMKESVPESSELKMINGDGGNNDTEVTQIVIIGDERVNNDDNCIQLCNKIQCKIEQDLDKQGHHFLDKNKNEEFYYESTLLNQIVREFIEDLIKSSVDIVSKNKENKNNKPKSYDEETLNDKDHNSAVISDKTTVDQSEYSNEDKIIESDISDNDIVNLVGFGVLKNINPVNIHENKDKEVNLPNGNSNTVQCDFSKEVEINGGQDIKGSGCSGRQSEINQENNAIDNQDKHIYSIDKLAFDPVTPANSNVIIDIGVNMDDYETIVNDSEQLSNVIVVNNKSETNIHKNEIVLNHNSLDRPELKFTEKDEKDLEYHLVSVIVHSGTVECGHYICYKRINENWFLTNDSEIRPVSDVEVLSSQAYILFYEMSSG